jgi:hypothetical protein
MGLGKTVEVIACILANPAPIKNNTPQSTMEEFPSTDPSASIVGGQAANDSKL